VGNREAATVAICSDFSRLPAACEAATKALRLYSIAPARNLFQTFGGRFKMLIKES
jgi:hypothetical protein